MKMRIPDHDQQRLNRYQHRMRKHPPKAEAQFKHNVIYLLETRYGIKAIHQKLFWDLRGYHDRKAYILDFYFPSLNLAIEIDGASHQGTSNKMYDRIRDSFFSKKGIRVVRITNQEVKNIDACIKRVYKEIEAWQSRKLNRDSKPTEPIIMDRDTELAMQAEFIKNKGITVLPTIGPNRKPLGK